MDGARKFAVLILTQVWYVYFQRSNLDLSLDVNPDESGLIDASTLRRQVKSLVWGLYCCDCFLYTNVKTCLQ